MLFMEDLVYRIGLISVSITVSLFSCNVMHVCLIVSTTSSSPSTHATLKLQQSKSIATRFAITKSQEIILCKNENLLLISGKLP